METVKRCYFSSDNRITVLWYMKVCELYKILCTNFLGSLFSSLTLDFLRDLGRRISHISGDDREVLFLFQRISVTIQRFHSVLLHDSFSVDRPDH